MQTSLIIPCYNEAEGIAYLCERLRTLLRGLDGDSEVVFVDDGSTDATIATIEAAASGLPWKLVRHTENRGISAAIRSGIEAARGEVVVTMDSDCTYDPDQVPDLLAAVRAGADVATASPYHPDGAVLGVPAWRLVLSKGLSRLYWMVLPVHLHTYTSCFRAAPLHVARRLPILDDGFLGVAQFVVEAILQGRKVVEVPAVLTTRKFGQSKIRVAQVSKSHLAYLVSLLWRRRRPVARTVAEHGARPPEDTLS